MGYHIKTGEEPIEAWTENVQGQNFPMWGARGATAIEHVTKYWVSLADDALSYVQGVATEVAMQLQAARAKADKARQIASEVRGAEDIVNTSEFAAIAASASVAAEEFATTAEVAVLAKKETLWST